MREEGDIPLDIKGPALVRHSVIQNPTGANFLQVASDGPDRILAVLQHVIADDEIEAALRDLVQLFGNEAPRAAGLRQTKFDEKIVVSGRRIDLARLLDLIINTVRDLECRAKFAFDLNEKRFHGEACPIGRQSMI